MWVPRLHKSDDINDYNKINLPQNALSVVQTKQSRESERVSGRDYVKGVSSAIHTLGPMGGGGDS